MTEDPGLRAAAQPFWYHCTAGMHIGRMEPRPMAGEFDCVLTLAAEPGTVDDSIRHRHIPVSYIAYDETFVENVVAAVDWVHAQFLADRKVLIRSEGGKERPALIVAIVCLRMGATPAEAMYTARRNLPTALSDFRYRNAVTSIYQAMQEHRP